MDWRQLPFDVWQNVVGNFETQEAVRVVDALWSAGAFPGVSQLDAFWAVIMSARHASKPEGEFQLLPDPDPYVSGVDKLVEFGVDRERAIVVFRDANGSWEVAMNLLGWD